ncbi:MAG: hypothetical protein ACR2LR_06040 [Hassallia sp.]
MSFLKKYTIEFSSLELGEKICLFGSWVTAAGAGLILTSSACTLYSWFNGIEPSNQIKHALAIGFGMTVGGAMFTVGAAKEADRQSELEAEEVWSEIFRKRAARDTSPCPKCKYFSGDSDLYCALYPAIACTPDADNCKDFESKEIN